VPSLSPSLQAWRQVRSRDAALAGKLRRVTAAEVKFDGGSRAMYATDASNYRQVPIGVVLPRSLDDIVATMEACRDHDVPVLLRGGGTSLAGQCCNAAVVIDTSRHCNRIVELDPAQRSAVVEPGVVLDELRDAAERHGLTFGPDPSTHSHNTLGGMIGNDSCGVHSVTAGRTSMNVESLEILTYDGLRTWVGETSAVQLQQWAIAGGRFGGIHAAIAQLVRDHGDRIRSGYPDIPRRVSGFNLPALLPENGTHIARSLVGSEGTCVAVLQARLRLVESPPRRSLVVLGFDDVFAAADHVPCVLEHAPIGLEGMDGELRRYMQKKHMGERELDLLPAGDGWLLVEFGAASAEGVRQPGERLIESMRGRPGFREGVMFVDPAVAARLWKIRESGLGATSSVPGEPQTHPGWEDAAVAPAQLGRYLRRFRALMDDFGYRGALYGHFGDGCVHVRISSDLRTIEGLRRWREFVERAADLVVEHGGSLSGEHGDGQARGELLGRMFGPDLVDVMRQFKRIWDPQDRMNPGKVVDAAPLDAHLRHGPGTRLEEPRTVFSFAEDGGSFARAAARCVGVGECRRDVGALMCPSYQGTHEEQHSTRGRARLLFEMLDSAGAGGEEAPIPDGWRSDAVREALHLCLSCKGCKSECPVNVDMATYKAEFMHHHYRGRLRPRVAYSMGLVRWWARAATQATPLVNWATRAPLLSRLVKAAGGIAQARELPRFADPPFTRRVGAGASDVASADVCLFPDTFSNHFRPAALEAAMAVLEALGQRVALPRGEACCGRPLFAEGMLTLARRQLSGLMASFEPAMARGLPVIGLEPSCLASLRDELPALFPDDPRARYLATHSRTIAEHLRACNVDVPRLAITGLAHLHCNHRAVLGIDADTRLFDQLFDCATLPAPGCCGMAGPFGFAADRYALSQRIASQQLLPAVRAAAPGTVLLADGFSCYEQIRQATGREAWHAAEAVATALGATRAGSSWRTAS
jgi:FAD/FMN-containing dehydrogenase/Fe-S oxidoreductase